MNEDTNKQIENSIIDDLGRRPKRSNAGGEVKILGMDF